MSTAAPTRRAPIDERFRARRRAVQRARLRRRRRITLTVLTLLMVGGAGVAVARSPLFQITEIRVLGTERAAEVVEASGLVEGDNLLAADLEAARGAVTQLGWVRTAEAVRLPPSAVQIHVVVRQPAVVVQLLDSSWLLDGDAVVLAGGGDDTLPVVSAPDSVLPGVGAQASDAAVRNALAAHEGLPDGLRARVDHYDASSVRGLRLHLRGVDGEPGVWVRFGAADRISAKARVLELLLEQVRDQAERQGEPVDVRELDVRAPDNPVLVPADS